MRTVFKALISNGLFSAMSLMLSVIIARSGGTEALGLFGVAFAAYLLIQLITRDAGANTLSATLPTRRKIRVTAERISLMGTVFAVPIVLVGFIMNWPYLLIVGLAIHGLCLYDYSKTLSLSLHDGSVALMQDALLFVIFSVAAALAWAGVIEPIALMACWAFGGAALGYTASWFQGYRLRPRWLGDPDELKTSLAFGFQSFIGSGSVHVLTFLLAGVGGPNLVGSMRGASTIIGPANLVTSSLQPLLITNFARTAPKAGAISMSAVIKSGAGMVAVQLILASVLTAAGYMLGENLLGAAWPDSEPLLFIVAADAVLVSAGAAPLAAHRSLWKSGRLARINTWMVVMRVSLVLVGAVLWGAQGAVIGFLTVTFMASTLWWTSLAQLHRK